MQSSGLWFLSNVSARDLASFSAKSRANYCRASCSSDSWKFTIKKTPMCCVRVHFASARKAENKYGRAAERIRGPHSRLNSSCPPQPAKTKNLRNFDSR
jgi:hypothetical protein